ncbi:MAG TPA: DUF3558 family protein [Amycolatopsis sp.]|nr:DUF3558 family protein [Amycolatopsis sp.]
MPVAAGFVVLVAGCGAHPPAPAAVSSARPDPGAAPSSSVTGLAALDPCALLSTVDRSTAGLSAPGQGRTIGGNRACDWTQTGVYGLTITLDDRTALADLTVAEGTGQRLRIGRHPAIKVSDTAAGDGTCAVLLSAGDNASAQVDVTNSGFSDTTLACDRAGTVARLIEPELP